MTNDSTGGNELSYRSMTRSEVVEMLARAEFGGIHGVLEDRQIDFKGGGQPYDLSSARGKRDLVADIAAFANAQGGILVLGVNTKLDPEHQLEYADEVVGAMPGVYTEKRVLDLIRAHCHPPVTDVDVRVYSGHNIRGRAIEIVAIVVEAQSDANSPVLVDRLVSDDAGKLGSAFGWPTRHGADTSWTHGSRIQQLIGTALRTPAAKPPSIPIDSRRERHLELVHAEDGWQDWAIVAMQMSPKSDKAHIEDFYGSFRVAANGWRGIRDSGFGLALQWQPLEPSGDILVSQGSRTALIVGPDGLVTAAALGSPGFLGWAQHREETLSELKSVTLNPYPLVEFVSEAIRFVYGVVAPKLEPTTWQLRVLGMHLQDRVPVAVRLQPGDRFFSTPVPATAPNVDATIEGTGNWDTDAYLALEALLGRGFGVARDDIPFARAGTVNPENFD